jgi:CubicO group peptidase (beta-lactamase class C family)
MAGRRGERRSSSVVNVALTILCVLMVLVQPQAALAQAQGPLRDLDGFIERGMRDWEIPGMAVAVVRNDSVIYARGHGVRRLGVADRVDEHTLFGIASVSKAFTAAALGLLVDEGRLSWDDAVVDHLPAFRLYDPYITQATTVRDLLAHRVGIGRMTGNRLRWLPHRPREELIRRIRFLEPEQSFRDGYVYSNVGYMIAGELIPAITGESWESFVERRLFAPLGMRRSNTSITAIAPGENAAWPHQEIDGSVVEIQWRDFDAVGPAASINSSAAEIAAWMRLHLGDPGVFEGTRLLSHAVMAEMHRAQNVTREADFAQLASYGFGWSLGSYQGHRVSRHGGATDGMNTMLVLVPGQELGIFVTTNTFNDFMNAVVNHILDAALDLPVRDWHTPVLQAYRDRYDAVQRERDAIHAARQAGTSTSVPLAAFAGRFYDDLYAEAEVLLQDGRLLLRLWDDDTQVADLEHWHHDTFRAIWRNRAMREEFVWFSRGADGRIAQLHVDWALRPALLQVGAYPAPYRRVATWSRIDAMARN